MGDGVAAPLRQLLKDGGGGEGVLHCVECVTFTHRGGCLFHCRSDRDRRALFAIYGDTDSLGEFFLEGVILFSTFLAVRLYCRRAFLSCTSGVPARLTPTILFFILQVRTSGSDTTCTRPTTGVQTVLERLAARPIATSRVMLSL